MASSFRDKLDRMEAWLDRQNAAHDEWSRARPTWWHAGKVVFGILFMLRGCSLALNATGFGGFAVALLFLIGGVALAIEGLVTVRERRGARTS